MKRSSSSILLVSLILTLGLSASTLDAQCPDPAVLVERVLDGQSGWGALAVRAQYLLGLDAADQGRLGARIETRLDATTIDGALCFGIVLVGEEVLTAYRESVPLRSVTGEVRLGIDLRLPDTTEQIVVVAQHGDNWGVALADEAFTELAGPTGANPIAGGGWLRASSAEAAPRGPARGTELRLVPPRDEVVAGAKRIYALTARGDVDRVRFVLDGEPAGEDGTAPFSQRIDFADPPREQTLVAVALADDGTELGTDTLTVNRPDRPFRATITDLSPASSGGWQMRGRVSVPAGATLSSVEVFLNEALISQGTDPEVAIEIPVLDAGPTDYVRLAAVLADGSSIDDVVLLAAPSLSDEVDVNLVELVVSVADGNGWPIGGLDADAFQVTLDGERLDIASFSHADDIPLTLGLVIDTSGSMELIMQPTRVAAAIFLQDLLRPGDRAFVVDFADRPRLLAPITDDLTQTLLALGRLQPQGATAMYDAIVFSMLQLEDDRGAGRRALVVLTDGDDRDSRFGPSDAVTYAQEAGVPIYLIGLGGLDQLRRTLSKRDLRRVTDRSGGRLFFVDQIDLVGDAYDTIGEALRKQYVLGVYTASDLDRAALRRIEVGVDRDDTTVYTVIGQSRR